jgi:succinate dehydrogenase / fumarate reductase cytochrome b subunit
MSQTTRAPRYYQRGSWSRTLEGILHYGGGPGQWSWLVHRVTGLGILAYLFAHITDTFFVVVNPAWYDHAMDMYGGWVSGQYFWPVRWAFRIGELGLIACVLFHSINGLRIVLFDFWPRAVEYQHRLFRLVMIVFWTIMILVALWVLRPLLSTPRKAQEKHAAAQTSRATAGAPGPGQRAAAGG